SAMSRLFRIVVWAVLALGLLSPRTARGQEPAPKPLPADVVAAWEKAGATTGWMHTRQNDPFFHAGGKSFPGDVPAFHFKALPPGELPKLPPPSQPFGL